MKNSEKEIQAINSLIEINNDRIEGYKTASEETDQTDLKLFFGRFHQQSNKFLNELGTRVLSIGGQPATGTTVSGKVYRAWMDVKSALTNKDRKAILNSCEYGEDVALSAYKSVLNDDDISGETRKIIESQFMDLQNAHNEMKLLRDAQSV